MMIQKRPLLREDEKGRQKLKQRARQLALLSPSEILSILAGRDVAPLGVPPIIEAKAFCLAA